ncbi:hypothetical protein HYH02_011781 [Chlamydomonas schloesseri]|uniref:Uncharacterized protein n=1 Tax=Chlamydomonas schloesseri TaxID=2026947 RepID=A0A835TC55_9CHLO|nr:hypothetical protein HYH02_011781 [Chlamydomonas schloesseri]|eukprot:KAG2435486.1 hypothetical protein HYH02_011781 [Chlamydomonas schloesseri]
MSRSSPLRKLVAITTAAAAAALSGSGPAADPPQQQKAPADDGRKQQQPQPAAVIGVDFGTSGSGYAAILAPGATDPQLLLRIKSCAQWPDDPAGSDNSGELKTKTAILYRGGRVDSIGWSAWKRWMSMTATERQGADWCYLEGFKLLLDERPQQQGGPDLVALGVSSELPRGKSAVDVVVDYLSELRRFTVKRLQAQAAAKAAGNNGGGGGGGGAVVPSLDTSSLVWCVTVPAMWEEKAKQKLRSAANRAGLVTAANPESLILALEPEAAAVAMVVTNRIAATRAAAAQQHEDPAISAVGALSPVTGGQQKTGRGGASASAEQHLADGDVVLVVDCGGGTADVTLHEVAIDAAAGDSPMTIHLKEAAVGKGVLAGGRFVDAALWELLRGQVVGPALWDEWMREHPGEWTDLAMRWESKKRAMKRSDTVVELQLPPGLAALWQQQAPSRQLAKPGVSLDSANGLVHLDKELLRTEVFGPAMEKVAAAVAEVESEGRRVRGKKATKMLLAGGFCNSYLLRERLRELAKQLGLPLLAPPMPGAAVVTGTCAALLGAEPGLVRARRCRLTYGIRCRCLWSSEEAVSHSAFGYPQRIWKPEDSEYYADGVFETFARRGQLVKTDETVKRTFCPTSSTTVAIAVDVYATEAPEARYVGEPGMRRVAEVTLELPAGWRQGVTRRTDYDVEVELKFGAAEITVVARDPRTRNAVAARFDWL